MKFTTTSTAHQRHTNGTPDSRVTTENCTLYLGKGLRRPKDLFRRQSMQMIYDNPLASQQYEILQLSLGQ